MNRVLQRCLVPGLAGGAAVLVAGALALGGIGGVGGPDCVGAQAPGSDVERRIDCGNGGPPPPPSACAATAGFSSVAVAPRGRGLGIRFTRRVRAKATVDLLQQSSGRRILGNRRVALFRNGTSAFSFAGARGGDGVYVVRFRVPTRGGRTDVRRLTVERRRGRFRARPDYYRRASCDAVSSFKLERPVFGGRSNRALNVAYRLARGGRVTVTVLRGSKVLRRFPAGTRRANRTYRLRFPSEHVARGDIRVRLKAGSTTATLTSRRL
jgi:hypothetical protein